jgi:hypothetical protein
VIYCFGANARERKRERKRREREREREGEKQKQCFRERSFPLTFDKNSSIMTTNTICLRLDRSLQKMRYLNLSKFHQYI